MDIENIFSRATGLHETIPEDWMPATGMRPLQNDDPGLLWLKFHGDDAGFAQDSTTYAFTPFICKKGHAFEAMWIKKEAPNAVRAMAEDWDVRQAASFRRTLELMQQRVPVITKAAVWWEEEKIYGSCDLICLQSWLFKKFRHLRPDDYEYKEADDHYTVIDMKYTSGLHTYSRRKDLEKYGCQLQTYAYALSHIQNKIITTVYIVSRDRIHTPIEIETNLELGKPLPKALRDFRNEYRRIKLRGDRLKPWVDKEVAVSPQNKEDFPFHDAKNVILTELMKGQSLTRLPGVGNTLANALEDAGYECVTDLLALKPEDIPLEDIPGFGFVTAARIRAVLKANRSKRATKIPLHVVPPKTRSQIELHIDCEFLSNVNSNLEKEWPTLTGTPMIAVIGAGWYERGKWCYQQFESKTESHLSEKRMLQEFEAFLEIKGVFDEKKTAALYCWGDAERAQTLQAVARHGRTLKRLADLPWFDLLAEVFHEVPIAIPGQYSFNLKEVSSALSAYDTAYATSWPEGLNSGNAAAVAIWEAYSQPKPLETKEWALVSEYLEQDCRACAVLLKWVRDCTKDDVQKSIKSANGSWYKLATGRDFEGLQDKSNLGSEPWYAWSLQEHKNPQRTS